MEYQIEPIAKIKSDFLTKFGVPRQSGLDKDIISYVIFEKEFSNLQMIKEIKSFSHIWLLFLFDKVKTWQPMVRPPKLGGNKKVGVFASRSPFRPNHIGLSCVKLLDVIDDNGKIMLKVGGGDLVNGTPIIDIKPYLPFTDCIVDAVGGYADEHKDERLKVEFLDGVKDILPQDKLQTLVGALSLDPRPGYKVDDDKEYGFKFCDKEVKFKVNKGVLTVTYIG